MTGDEPAFRQKSIKEKLRKIHLYLGCIFSPMLMVFALTGATQMFGVRLGVLSEVHLRGGGSLALAILAFFMGLSVIITSLLGISMAFRSAEDRKKVWACLAFGVLVPAILVVIAHFRNRA